MVTPLFSYLNNEWNVECALGLTQKRGREVAGGARAEITGYFFSSDILDMHHNNAICFEEKVGCISFG